MAEEVYYNESGGDISGSYADNLTDLLSYDRNLTDDTAVTFQFGTCNQTGYTFTTQHLLGDAVYTFTD